jgi:CBS domain-containing protein
MIAADVMTRDVVTVRPDTPVAELVQLLLTRSISGVPVVDTAGNLVGVASEGDLLRRAELGTEKTRGGWATFFTGAGTLATDYVRANARLVGDVMTRVVVTVNEDTPLSEIADLMEERHIKRVPVVRDTRLVGIVTRSNLLRALASTLPAAPASTGTTPPADDAAIRAALSTELARHAWSRRAENSVVVTEGVVHLWGMVSTAEESRALELAAQGVPGVRAVENHMIVLSEEPYPLVPGPYAA